MSNAELVVVTIGGAALVLWILNRKSPHVVGPAEPTTYGGTASGAAPGEGTKDPATPEPTIDAFEIRQEVDGFETRVVAQFENNTSTAQTGTAEVFAELEDPYAVNPGWDTMFRESQVLAIPARSSFEVMFRHSDWKEAFFTSQKRYRLAFTWNGERLPLTLR